MSDIQLVVAVPPEQVREAFVKGLGKMPAYTINAIAPDYLAIWHKEASAAAVLVSWIFFFFKKKHYFTVKISAQEDSTTKITIEGLSKQTVIQDINKYVLKGMPLAAEARDDLAHDGRRDPS